MATARLPRFPTRYRCPGSRCRTFGVTIRAATTIRLVADVTDPSDWQILVVALLRRLGGTIELTADELADTRRLLDPVEHETMLVTYRASFLAPELLTVELRSRPRTSVNEALGAFLEGVLKGGDHSA